MPALSTFRYFTRAIFDAILLQKLREGGAQAPTRGRAYRGF